MIDHQIKILRKLKEKIKLQKKYIRFLEKYYHVGEGNISLRGQKIKHEIENYK